MESSKDENQLPFVIDLAEFLQQLEQIVDIGNKKKTGQFCARLRTKMRGRLWFIKPTKPLTQNTYQLTITIHFKSAGALQQGLDEVSEHPNTC